MNKIIQVITIGLAMTTSVHAAPIDWGLGAQNITGDSDVSTEGTLVDAFNLGPSGVTLATVNGINFAPFVFPGFASFSSTVTSGNYNFTETTDGLVLNSYNNLGTGTGLYSLLTPEYRTLLSSGGSSTFVDTLQLTISGLTIGQTYQFQWWDNNSSLATSPGNGNQLNTTATAENGIGLDQNILNVNGGLGQFAIGTFTADDTIQIIDFNGNGSGSDPMLNAFQLRAEPIPEPSICATLGIGALMLIMKLRRRNVMA